jgi:hypothetical protein
MKRTATIFGGMLIVLFLGLVSTGCQIHSVDQPASGPADTTITVVLDVEDGNLPGDAPDPWVLCALVPTDWSVVSASYDAFWRLNGVVGGSATGTGSVSAAWSDTANANFPPPPGYTWIAVRSDTGYIYGADTLHVTASLQLKVGKASGTYGLKYLITKAASGLINQGSIDANWAAVSGPHSFTVTGGGPAVETVGGPYTVDTNTVVLLHFDGNLDNAAAAVGKTALAADPHTTNASGITFVNNLGVDGMGQCVHLTNGAITDSTFLTLAETTAVDLQGDWTIEAWASIFTFGDNSNDWRWVPRVVMKPGNDIFYQPNYWMEMWGDSRTFQTGFFTTGLNWISGTSPINMFVPTEWVHLTFIRDTKRGVIVQMVHDANRNLKSFTSTGFNPATDIPRPVHNPVHMGWAGGIENDPAARSVDSWLDGFIDEIRISKVVRNFPGPPLVTKTLALPNQPTSAPSYTITSNIQPFTQGATISSAMLHYYTTQWDSMSMTPGADNVYSANIPQKAYGTLIKYWVSASDNNGLRSTEPQNAESASPTFFSFYVYQPNVQTLWLTFEEGPGQVPADHSPSNSKVVLPSAGRIPDYGTPSAKGTYGLHIWYPDWGASPVPSSDSNWVEVSSPFLSAEEFTLDAWLKADSLFHAIRVINLPGDSTDYFNNNFEIEIRTHGSTFGWVGRYSAPDGTLYSVQDPNDIQIGKWYHLIWERKKILPDSGVVALMVRDENDQVEWSTRVDGKKAPLMGGSKTPGARMRIGRGNPNSADWWNFIHPFPGMIDEVKVFNYAQSGITSIDVPPGSQMPGEFALDQNYPNPFNPSTRIRFEIPMAAQTSIVIYDLLGRKVRTLVSDYMHAGKHQIQWQGVDDMNKPVASGMYVYELRSGTMVKSLKMMLLK